MYTNFLNSIRHTAIVRVQQGKLVGSIKEGAFGTMYKAFLGIPYATPPFGELKFKDPQPPQSWEGYRVVTDDWDFKSAQRCREPFMNVIGSEDCLYLNVYVPHEHKPYAMDKAVMVWIHDGDFYYGSGDYSDIRPDYFMKKDVILITVNYRLGILGFLNLGHKEASGNQGLKDQVAALKWIRENIHNFGGDRENITIFGNGTGAISAHLLMLSPLSKGLFHKAILQSGVALCNWAIKEKQSEGFILASSLGCTSTQPTEVLEFLRTVPSRVLVLAESNMVSKKERSIRKVIFGPTIDKESENPLLPCSISELLDNGNDISIMIGHNTEEMSDSYSEMIDEQSLKEEDLNSFIEQFAGSHNLDKVQSYKEQILSNYGPTDYFNKWHPDIIKRFLSDLYYNYAIRSVVINRVKQKKARTYYYVFSYSGDEIKERDDITKLPVGAPKVSHGKELPYMFYMPKHRHEQRNFHAMMRKDYDIINMITSSWSSFARTGDPNFSLKTAYSEWHSVQSENNITCFEINRQPSGWIREREYLFFTNKWY